MVNSEYITQNDERHGHSLFQDDIPEFPGETEETQIQSVRSPGSDM